MESIQADGLLGHPDGALGRVSGTERGPVGPGLVSPETSDKRADLGSQDLRPSPGSVTVFRHDGRLRRMRGSVQSAAQLLQEEAQAHGHRCKAAMLTLTYRPEVDWSPRHVTGLLKNVREWHKRRGHVCRYAWVLELTEAGRPHYHVLFWLPRGLTLPKPDKQGWWPHGMTRIEWARSPVGYLVKYASKGIDGDELPKGARLSGCGGLSGAARAVRSWRLCPA